MVELEVEAAAVQLVANTIIVVVVGPVEAASIAAEEGAEASVVAKADTAQELVSIGEGAGEAEGATEEVVGAAGAEAGSQAVGAVA